MIRRFLDVSSGHLSAETWAWLDEQLADDRLREPMNSVAAGIAGGRTRHGWFVYAAEEANDYPADLGRVCSHARSRGAEYVLLDCDAIPNQDLPVLHPDFVEPSHGGDADQA